VSPLREKLIKKNPRYGSEESHRLTWKNVGYFTGFGSGRLDVRKGKLVLAYQRHKAMPESSTLVRIIDEKMKTVGQPFQTGVRGDSGVILFVDVPAKIYSKLLRSVLPGKKLKNDEKHACHD